MALSPAFHEKELLVVGSSDGWDYRAHAAWYFDAVRRDGADLAQIFDMEVSADELAGAFERLATNQAGATKVLVRY